MWTPILSQRPNHWAYAAHKATLLKACVLKILSEADLKLETQFKILCLDCQIIGTLVCQDGLFQKYTCILSFQVLNK
jgi:hypothetical protein